MYVKPLYNLVHSAHIRNYNIAKEYKKIAIIDNCRMIYDSISGKINLLQIFESY